jgi:hypothetical protein
MRIALHHRETALIAWASLTRPTISTDGIGSALAKRWHFAVNCIHQEA